MRKSKLPDGQIIILGMHRSGTSCLGNVLTRLGIYFGGDSISTGANEENPKGFFERRDVRDICDLILQGSGCDWWAISDFSVGSIPAQVSRDANKRFSQVIEELDAHRPWFIKEPRLCFVFPVLQAQVSRPIFVHVWRHPVEVAQSLAVRNGFPMDFGIALWEAYVRSAHVVSRGCPSILISYNALLRAPEREVRSLLTMLRERGVTGLAMPSKQEVRDAVDPVLYRNRLALFDPEDLLSAPQRRLLVALKKGEANNSALFEPLAASSRVRLQDWTRREGIVIALQNRVREGSRTRAEVSRLTSDISTQKQTIARLENELASREAHKAEELDRLTRDLCTAAAAADARAAAIEQLSAELRRAIKSTEESTDAATALAQRQAEQVEGIRAEPQAVREAVRDRDALLEELRTQGARGEEQVKSLNLALKVANETICERDERLEDLHASARRREDEIESLKSDLHAAREAVYQRDEQLNQARAELNTALQQQKQSKTEVIRLEDEIRRKEYHIEEVRSHINALRTAVERKVAELLEKTAIDGLIESAQAAVRLRYSGASAMEILLNHESGNPDRRFERGLRLLYARYRWFCGRTDATVLVRIATSGLFDARYYLEEYPDVAKAGCDPLIHFVDFGANEGRNPSPLFDTAYYLRSNPDVAAEGVNPLLHFILHGRNEERLPRSFRSERIQVGNWTLPPVSVTRGPDYARRPRPERVVIYTAIAGGYDELKPPTLQLANCDFVVFSDQELEVEGWQTRPFNYFHRDFVRASRFVKLHPHIYFSDYDHSIWLDANIGIRGDIRVLFDYLDDQTPIGMFVHPYRDCIFVEGVECIRRVKDAPEIINHQLERYRAEGFPENVGLWETGVLVRNHNDPACIGLMTEWWREIEVGSRRDQISLPVAVSRLDAKIAPLGPPGMDLRQHEAISFVKHPEKQRVLANNAPPRPPIGNIDIASISVDIGVCVYNSPLETRACLDSLMAARRPQDRIIIVDDGSDMPTATFLEQFAADHSGVILVRHDQNRGYTVSANTVFAKARGDWVFLVNSDAIVPSRALVKLVARGEQFPRLGVLGPLSNAASWQTVPRLTSNDGRFFVNEIPSSLNVEDLDCICEEVSAGRVLFVPLVNGFCLGIRRMLVERLGGFDEVRFPRGYGEEDDFCLRTGAAGFLCGVAADTYVYHSKSASFSPEGRLPLAAAGAKALRAKHSADRIAAAVETLKHHPELRRIREQVGERLRVVHPESSVEHT